MPTTIHIEVGEVAHTMKTSRVLSPDQERRLLQALCDVTRIFQLWLEQEDDHMKKNLNRGLAPTQDE